MSILDTIVKKKQEEIAERKSLYPEKLLQRSIYFETQPLSLKKYLQREDLSGIIAEFKRRSPSKGDINPYVDVEATTLGYMQAGASALSILTDFSFFGGSNNDLTVARKFNYCPILRKDFIIDPYQVIEAKSIGADAILLIAAILEKEKIAELAQHASRLGMEVLLELHDADEIFKIPDSEVLIGVNNRNLKTMETDVATAFNMLHQLPANNLKIAESGLSDAETICKLKTAGYQGFLIGEFFMKHSRPAKACKKLFNQIKSIKTCPS
jgi:indole-3-glycerol phosphate synthase